VPQPYPDGSIRIFVTLNTKRPIRENADYDFQVHSRAIRGQDLGAGGSPRAVVRRDSMAHRTPGF